MCPDPCCYCIQGCIAIFGCARNIDNDKSKLEKAHKYLEDNRSDLNKKIEEVWQLNVLGTATDQQKNWLKSAVSEKGLLDNTLGSETSPKPLTSDCLACRIYCCRLGAKVDAREDRLKRLLEHPCIQEIKVHAQTPLVVPFGLVEMFGMESKFREFWRIFDDEGAPIIGIHGMPGIGKSAFLMKVNNEFNNPNNRQGFEKVIWVDSSSTGDIKGIQGTIAERLGLDCPQNVTSAQLAGAIYRELRGINFVLLLDNLPDGLELSAIGVPLPTSGNEKKTSGNEKKCKIVFTAQRRGIWSNLRPPPRVFDLGLLDNGPATELFNRMVGEQNLNADREVRALAATIVHRCFRLPKVLVEIGRHLCSKKLAEWKDTRDWLKCPESTSPGQPDGRRVYESLKSAYKSLGNSATQDQSLEQKCFLYCCLFPDGYIEEEELKRHWVAEDFLGIDKLHNCLVRGDSILDTLKRAHLLMNAGGQPAIEMHPQVYNFGRWISSRPLPEGSQNKFYVQSSPDAELNELPTDLGLEQVERISLADTIIGKLNKIDFSRLSTLILKKCIITDISSDFFEAMKTLKVLNLSESTLPDILIGIAGLTSLQYLNLSRSNIQKLTEDFKQLTKLIALDLSFTQELKEIKAGVLSSLSVLQWLNMHHCGAGSSSSLLEVMALLNEVLGLKSLQDLGITVRGSIALEKFVKSRHLKNTHSILIKDFEAAEVELNLTTIASAGRLKVLHIISCRSSLRFEEALIRAELCFQNLCDVKIEDCRNLEDLTWLRHAQVLESLAIGRCPDLTKLIDGGHGAAAGQPNQLPFPKLRYLRLEGLSLLQSICSQNLEFKELMRVTVLSCKNLIGISLNVTINREENIEIFCEKSWWEKNLDGYTKLKLKPVFQ